ncbi:hypothetical protein [Rhodalgimonas zhirmunskyi]|uniref:Uncharacterized protein n=1 Tax=Rhodalgimonas zhirmunskyi TaxID=2964767 RepID=A0AAJ1UCP3_9RHOB|nr:hypothetical protein [Rhodoalgimonas zhirmunskyi]MDQ2094046.1 hypothetical protein [Rhodoalgimonas zhirmunskyi]
MKRFLLGLGLCLSLGAVPAGEADAQQYGTPPGVDPQLYGMVSQIVMTLGNACNMGNGQACQLAQMAQQEAQVVFQAGYQCQMTGDPNACGFYQQNAMQIGQIYQQIQMAQMQGQFNQPIPGATGPGMGLTHEQRMQQIQQMGQQSTQNWRDNGRLMDKRHQDFLNTLRQ